MAVNVNDIVSITKSQELAASAAAPSNRYVDLPWVASETVLTAPGDGIVFITGNYNSTGPFDVRYIKLAVNDGTGLTCRAIGNNVAEGYTLILPIAKNKQFTLTYNVGAIAQLFRFIYSQGAQ